MVEIPRTAAVVIQIISYQQSRAMSSQTRPLEAVFVLSLISVVISTLGLILFIPAPWAITTIVYHAIIGIAHIRAKSISPHRNETDSRLMAAFAYMNDAWTNVWRSAVGGNEVRLEDGNEEEPGMEPQEPRERLHPAASLINIVVVCLLVVAWLALLGLTIAIAVLSSRYYYWTWWNARLWIGLFAVLVEIMVLIAIARICKRMRNKFFARVDLEGAAIATLAPVPEGGESSTRKADASSDSESLVVLEP